MPQNIIKVQSQDGVLVVDSRLIAERLGIMHKSFMETILKFQSRVEKRFGQLWFKTETVKNSVGAVNEVRFVLLTKPQAEIYMTFSRNTEPVIECKLDLVQAFNEAEKAYHQPVNKVKETIEGAKALTEYLTDLGIEKTIAQSMSLDAIAQSHPELKPMCEPAKKLLSTATAHKSVGMNATQVGKHFEPELNPREVNEILELLGLQFKQPKKKRGKDSYQWQLTEEGKEHGFVYFATQVDKWSGDQIRWQDSVVEVIWDYLDSRAA